MARSTAGWASLGPGPRSRRGVGFRAGGRDINVPFRSRFIRRKTFHALLDESADLLEARMAGTAHPFKDTALARRQDRSGMLKAAQRHVVVDPIAGTDGIDRD